MFVTFHIVIDVDLLSMSGVQNQSTERQSDADRPVADTEQIELEISAELARCSCALRFPCERLDDGKYKVLYSKLH